MQLSSFSFEYTLVHAVVIGQKSAAPCNTLKNCTPQISGGQNVWLPIR
jgi:hypothetical protein